VFSINSAGIFVMSRKEDNRKGGKRKKGFSCKKEKSEFI